MLLVSGCVSLASGENFGTNDMSLFWGENVGTDITSLTWDTNFGPNITSLIRDSKSEIWIAMIMTWTLLG